MKYPVPKEVFEQHVAILAKTGRGKTVAAKGAAARLMKSGLRAGAVDPTAAWWGMRLKADGISPAFPMVIFGGDHGDIEIDRRMGAKVGALVAAANWSWIIDISKMGVEERTPFMTEFAEALFASNRRRLNLFLDECHLYMPQQKLPTKASAHMTMACNNLVSGGRSRGLCITMISQRSAKVHKDSLTQAEALITLGMIAPQDIAAVEAWVKVQGDMKTASAMLKSLPSLPVGQGYVYAPELGLLDRVKFPMVDTFDSSRAPGVGEDLRAPTDLGQINIEEIKAQLVPKPSKPTEKSNTAAKPKDLTDMMAVPPTFRALTKALSDAFKEGQASVQATIPALLDAQHEASLAVGYDLAVRDFRAMAGKGMALSADNWPPRPSSQKLSALLSQHKPPGSKPAPEPRDGIQLHISKVTSPAEVRSARRTVQSALSKTNGLDRPLKRILDAIRWWNVLGVEAPNHAQVGFLAKYAAGSGTWNRYLSSLRSLGLIEPAGPLQLTVEGAAQASEPEDMPTGAAAREAVLGRLDGPCRRIMEPVLEAYPGGLSHEDAAAAANYVAGSGTWNRYLSTLRSQDLIEPKGALKAKDWLFPEA